MDEPPGPPGRRDKLHGRRRGRKLRPGQHALLTDILPRYALGIDELAGRPPEALFAERPRAVWLEIGFGGGEHLAAQAEAHPEVGLIGVEPFVTGVARLLSLVEERGLRNVRLLADDARLLLAALPDASLERVFVLFPDPWPKARHHKRRIVNRATLAELARVMRSGAELRLATDDPDYARWMLEAALAEPCLDWLAERAADWRERPSDWPPTRYEAKALVAGRRPVFFRFRRVDGT
jgi:tRNA (guanine-N7-)-methyltransferase